MQLILEKLHASTITMFMDGIRIIEVKLQLHMKIFTSRNDPVHVLDVRRANQRERIRYAAQTQP